MIEILNFPTKIDEYRVVQILTDDQEIYLFPKDGYVTHARMLKEYLEKKGIEYSLTKDKEGLQVPDLKGKKYEVIGMGYIIMDPEEKIYRGQSGGSAGYGLHLDEESLKRFEEDLKGEGWVIRKH